MYWGLTRFNSGALFSLYWGLCIFPLLGTLCMVSVYEKGEKILEIFKGTEGPYRIENERPWVGGYTVPPTCTIKTIM